MTSLKRILQYIQNTVDAGLVFEQDVDVSQHIVGYCDSHYAGDLENRRSTTGYLFTLARAQVSLKSTLQSTVALSTTEVEYMVVTEVVKEAIWLKGMLEDLGGGKKHIMVHCDSQSAICLARNQVFYVGTKHIDVGYHFVREILEESEIFLQKVETKENPTNVMTKVVSVVKFKRCLNLINILHV